MVEATKSSERRPYPAVRPPDVTDGLTASSIVGSLISAEIDDDDERGAIPG